MIFRAQDTKQLESYSDIYDSLRLDYENTLFKPSTDSSMGFIRFKTQDAANFKVPYSEAIGGNTSAGWPFTGNGFTAATNGQAITEFCVPSGSSVGIMEESEIYEIFKDGTEVLRAVFKYGKFVSIGG